MRRVVFGAVLVAFLVVGGTALRIGQVAGVDQARRADMIVVLGAAQYNGEPSAVLRSRLRHALHLYEQGYSEHIVTVGGGLSGDNYTEAEAGKMWLVDHGVPESDVIDVETGSDTLRSVRAADRTAEGHGWTTALFVSDPWHLLRCRTMAEDLGLTAWVSPTRSGPISESGAVARQYVMRETAAMLYYRLTHSSARISGTGLD